MMGMYRNPQITRKPKFSYATAQEYCELVKRSIDRVNSNSKKNGSPSKNTIKMTLKLPQEYRKQPTFKEMRERIRSRSNTNKESSQKSRSLSICQKTNPNSNNPSILLKKVLLQPRKICSYEQQHLLGTLQKENQELRNALKTNETKAKKIKQKIEEQRNTQNIQREMYEQQVKKLRETLQLQVKCRKQQEQTQQQSSIEESMNSENDFLF